jgi:uncharacterized protein (DUF427 family)
MSLRERLHRIEIEASPAHARIVAPGGEVIADTHRALLLHETGHAVRAYIPREDIRASVEPSPKTTHCPFKGDASYWTVAGVENAAWSYEDPKSDVAAIRGLLAFYPDRVSVEIGS